MPFPSLSRNRGRAWPAGFFGLKCPAGGKMNAGTLHPNLACANWGPWYCLFDESFLCSKLLVFIYCIQWASDMAAGITSFSSSHCLHSLQGIKMSVEVEALPRRHYSLWGWLIKDVLPCELKVCAPSRPFVEGKRPDRLCCGKCWCELDPFGRWRVSIAVNCITTLTTLCAISATLIQSGTGWVSENAHSSCSCFCLICCHCPSLWNS